MPWFVGIDENGLGPQLGPLIVTAVLAELSQDAAQRLESDPRGFMHERLADSKQLVDHHHVTLGEAWARALSRVDASSVADLIEKLSLEPIAALQSPCPKASKPMCWFGDNEAFAASQAQLDQATEDLSKLRAAGVDVAWTRSSITCVKRMNDAKQAGVTRSDLDLRSMEALILGARERAGEEIVARCGKVGGLMRYRSKFTHLSDYLITTLDEQRSESAYRVAGVGRVHFLRDAEEQDPLVSLASLVGKWVREVMMGRIVAYCRHHDASLGDASGYNDPVTDRFVRDSEALRDRQGIATSCFLRARSKEK